MLSAVVITRNEKKNLDACLKSLRFCDEIVIIDDYSSDDTLKIAKKHRAKIYQRKLNSDFAGQRNFGQLKANGQWILFIDADERVSESLEKEIKQAVRENIDGYYIKRRDFFWGKQLKYGETKKIRNKGLLRLVKKSSGIWMGNVHEVFHTACNTGTLSSYLDHYPHQKLSDFIESVNYYSSLRARELYLSGKKTTVIEIVFVPFFKFIFNFFFNLGFLDGAQGFVYAFMMSFHSFLVRSKLYQYKNEKNR